MSSQFTETPTMPSGAAAPVPPHLVAILEELLPAAARRGVMASATPLVLGGDPEEVEEEDEDLDDEDEDDEEDEEDDEDDDEDDEDEEDDEEIEEEK